MAINWKWENKLAKVELKEDMGEWKITYYRSNAMAAFIGENNKDQWYMYNFLIDKEHYKNCKKDNNNWFDTIKRITFFPGVQLTKDEWTFVKIAQSEGVEIIFESRPF